MGTMTKIIIKGKIMKKLNWYGLCEKVNYLELPVGSKIVTARLFDEEDINILVEESENVGYEDTIIVVYDTGEEMHIKEQEYIDTVMIDETQSDDHEFKHTYKHIYKVL